MNEPHENLDPDPFADDAQRRRPPLRRAGAPPRRRRRASRCAQRLTASGRSPVRFGRRPCPRAERGSGSWR